MLAVGGDHITNDISMGLRIPMTRAEKLKIEEGSVTLGNCAARRDDFAEGRLRVCRQGNRARDAEHDHSFAAARDLRAPQEEARGGTIHQLHRRGSFHYRRVQPAEWDRSSGRRNFRIARSRGPRPDDVWPDERFREPAIFRRDRADQVRSGRCRAIAGRRAGSAAYSARSSTE